MAFNPCEAANQRKPLAEVDIHFPELRNADKRAVLKSPQVLICLNCGKAEFKAHAR
jgi:hypothetical protein